MQPQTYNQWKKCIEEDCGIPLTRAFLSTRLTALKDASDDYTRRFQVLYGMAYLQQVIRWFETALMELSREQKEPV